MMNSEKQEQRNKTARIRSLITALLLITFTSLSSNELRAHEVWIETLKDGKVVARFAEYGNDFETSPGHLDSLDPLVAWTPDEEGKPKLMEVEKKSDHFTLGEVSSSQPIMLETGFPVMSSSGDRPARKPHFYARWQASLTETENPALTLDIVPTGEPGVVRIYFRGEPVAGVEVTLFSPDPENDQDLTSDEEGYVRFTTKDKGLHMIKLAHHREERKGFSGGNEFGLVSHNMSLTWIQE